MAVVGILSVTSGGAVGAAFGTKVGLGLGGAVLVVGSLYVGEQAVMDALSGRLGEICKEGAGGKYSRFF